MNQKVADNRKALVNKIVADMAAGKVFMWDCGHGSKPMSGLRPYNPITGTVYRGGNVLALYMSAREKGYSDPRWMTFRQAQEAKLKIRKGEQGTHIEYWDNIRAEQHRINSKTNEPALDDNGKPIIDIVSRPVGRSYVVFNAAQIENFPVMEPKQCTHDERNAIYESIIKNSEAKIFHDQDFRNFYRVMADEIHVMPKERFKTVDNYYDTVTHEIAHSTGHESRLDRVFSIDRGDYAREELRAELASMFLRSEFGLEANFERLENSQAYIQSWCEALKKDPNELFRAAVDADKAANYVRERMVDKELLQDLAVKFDNEVLSNQAQKAIEYIDHNDLNGERMNAILDFNPSDRTKGAENTFKSEAKKLLNVNNGRWPVDGNKLIAAKLLEKGLDTGKVASAIGKVSPVSLTPSERKALVSEVAKQPEVSKAMRKNQAIER